jgi:hypothetical protein
MTVAMVRGGVLEVTFGGNLLTDVLSARGQVSADRGWPQCSVFVTAKPLVGNEEDDISVVAGTSNVETRFVGKVRRFRPTAFPRAIEMLAMGTLAYAAEWAPHEEMWFDELFPSGATDQMIVQWALNQVPNVTYTAANIGGTGVTLGLAAPEAFNWQPGTSAWSYIQQLDRATLFRTYQTHDGTIYRVQMIGHPSSNPEDFTLANQDVLDGSSASRNTEQTRNAARVVGHDYGDGAGPVLGLALGNNDFQGDAADPALRHPEDYSSDLIEDGNDEDGAPAGWGGLNAQDIADAILNDVNKEFVEASVRTWRDDLHGPGQTCLLDTLDRLAIGEPMWVQDYAWEVGPQGWLATYGLTGGGVPQDYVSPPI